MTRPISPRLHGLLEYAFAPVWAIAPSTLDLHGLPAVLAYQIAAGILVLAVLTDYPMGLLRVVPFRVHGWIDALATPAVLGAPWLAGFSGQPDARNLFAVFGTTAIVVTALTDFRLTGHRAVRDPSRRSASP